MGVRDDHGLFKNTTVREKEGMREEEHSHDHGLLPYNRWTEEVYIQYISHSSRERENRKEGGKRREAKGGSWKTELKERK